MPTYEYRVVPAPVKGQKAKGVRGHEARFAHALQVLMNQMAEDGWEYQRAETLPAEERHGLTNTSTVYRNVLVFRRPAQAGLEPFRPRLLDAPAAPAELPAPATPSARPSAQDKETPDETPGSFFATASDNGVEDTGDLDAPVSSVLSARAQRLKTAQAPQTALSADRMKSDTNTDS
ncbi:DUF4177 domain-containing protein [Thalassobius sp. S69A]|uniref:DUF4177 domain-containing protein n=1 Tax=unclassified Thalassovita TaxID=2619711 RepID=UPI003C7C9882